MLERNKNNAGVAYFMSALDDKRVQRYKKFGEVSVEISKSVQTVITSIDGEQETENVARVGDAILTGPKGERYVLSYDKLTSRYTFVSKHADGTETWKPTGFCYAVPYAGETFSFDAPWGEPMICNDGDYIASTKTDGTDVYRIERGVFERTYKNMDAS